MLTADRLRELLLYAPQTGHFYWRRIGRGNGRWEGKRAGKDCLYGYVSIGVERKLYRAHRLAWLYVHGVWPNSEIDHIDGRPSNNAISNLRLASSSQQKMNKRVQSNNRSGLKGAYYHHAHKGKKWRSQIKVGSRLIFLGYFHTPEEASAAYTQAELEHFGEFASAMREA